MIRLAVDTSTMTQSVALERDGRVVAQRSVHRKAGHSTSIISSLEGVLADAEVDKNDVDVVLCGLGPGSFTGVRVGLSLALGFGTATGAKVGGVVSFYSLLPLVPQDLVVAIALDARKSEVYAGIWDLAQGWAPVIEPHTTNPQTFFERVAAHERGESLVLLGDGPSAYPEAYAPVADSIRRVTAHDTPLAANLFAAADRGFVQWKDEGILEPFYIRPSDAELNPRFAKPDMS